MRKPHESLVGQLAVIAVAWFLVVYVPAIGHGLIKDDFAWIAQSKVSSVLELPRLFVTHTGFYRPLVSLSFALDYTLFGLHPWPYGVTNLLLLGLTALAIARLASALRLPALAAVLAAGMWALNPHGINMALLWTSGRTSILLTLFAVLATTAFVRGRLWMASAFTLLAMLSKEEAVLLPVVLLVWALLGISTESGVTRGSAGRDGRDGAAARSMRAIGSALPVFLPLLIYGALRLNSGAMTPATAPVHYRFLTDARLIAVNAFEYLDRTATFPLGLALVATLVARRLPVIDRHRRRVIAFGGVWLVCGCALTVLVPSRSSLYACFPSVGTSLIAAVWMAGLAEAMPALRPRRVIAAIAILAIVAVPIYRARNQRWLTPARVSATLLPELEKVGPALPPGATLVILDRSPKRENIQGAFDNLLHDAVNLAAHRTDLQVWLEPPPDDWLAAGRHRPAPGPGVAVYEFKDRRLSRVADEGGAPR